MINDDRVEFADAFDSNQIQLAAAVAIKEYARFVVDLTRCTSMGDVAQLVDESPTSVSINDIVQYVLALSKKGLATVSPTPSISELLNHPVVRHVSAHRVSEALQDPKTLRTTVATEILQIIVAMEVLGGFELVDDECIGNTPPALVHDEVRTVQ